MDNLKTKYKFKAIFSKELREQIEWKGVCPDCKKPNTGRAWCNKCDPGRFLKEGKTSGSPEIDKFILEVQLKSYDYYDNLEWIPYDRFQDIKLISEGGFAIIFSATWLDGETEANRIKTRTGPITIALKKLKYSKNITENFTNEIKIYNECNHSSMFFTKFYGITKDPQTEEFMMVLEYAKYGNLREYIKNNFSDLKWVDKLHMLENIVYNLRTIHNRKYIHKDLHSGNILRFKTSLHFGTKITDLGLAQLVYNSDSSNVCGVLPYIAPEVLGGKPYTFASDVYSFGIIMIEVSTGKPPHSNISHDEKLALAICNGLRPRVAKGTPQCYIDLVNQCLDANPVKRPSTQKLKKIIKDLRQNDDYVKEFNNANEIISQKTTFETTIHPEAIYISHFMNFTNLPKPINSTRIQIEDLKDPNI